MANILLVGEPILKIMKKINGKKVNKMFDDSITLLIMGNILAQENAFACQRGLVFF